MLWTKVTQWQVVGCVGRISEQYLLPVLEAILHQFSFVIVEIHSDNGSEYGFNQFASLVHVELYPLFHLNQVLL